MNAILAKDHQLSKGAKALINTMHMLVIIASCVLIVWITRQTLQNLSFLVDHTYLKFQFWVCILFLLDIIVEWIFAPKKWKYICGHILFLLISIPYLNIIEHFNIHLSGETMYLLRFVPMIRAGYVLALVSGALSKNKWISMFWVYMIWVLASIYIGALMFFVEEHYINPQVDTFWTAIWWASLDMTTVGSNISAMTATGKVIAVILSGEGLMLFPVFTVYVTNAVIKKDADEEEKIAQQNNTSQQSDEQVANTATTPDTAQ